MKIKLFLFAFAIISFASCKDDGCSQSDWIGTYSIDSEDCADPNVTLDQTIVIAAGSTDETINIAGGDVSFTECSASDSTFFPISWTLDGNTLTVVGAGCTGVYTRN